MDKILLDQNLQKLSERLSAEGSEYVLAVDYLKSLRSLYSTMVSKTLSSDFRDVIQRFRGLHDQLFDMKLINCPPKVHMIYDHLQDFMEETGETLFFADTSGILP